ncbi:lipopolysaccharide biosynthesis protein [Desulfosporosinus hippei]|uniref:Polysaccharide transporter, PST family n=1 Tax=Desulfosporosinus hippei DSM 8344 TaxID=1121419 RepID=A0A1G8EUV3_9FIRM|nr:lipopolysaccharide biosynthesis protein [Desulfosporosinus hippei]SDH73597.1 polysaccharide transporter, PST family [Desulfosporosinus hippei DSM 8344]
MSAEKYNLQNKVVNAAKWSFITEIAAKIVSPITTMVLARILVPEAFGVVATVTMLISFADMFTDAGFQKYLVQREFKDEDEKFKNTNVAFWTNFFISLILWGISAIFSKSIATLVGNQGLANVIVIACIQLPLTSFSSIQMALYRRDFDFKTLFLVRVVAIFIPFFITIPLALLGLSYWALIIGTIFAQLSNTTILTIKSKWKPSLFYRLSILKEMLSFSIWSLIEAISIWLTMWVDAFIIGSALNGYYLGLYKTSTAMVSSLMALVTASVMPILFSSLSRLQNDEAAFKAMLYKVQRLVAYLVFPLGVGLFLYRDVATRILLGEQWIEASDIIGVWALTSAIMIIFSNFNSEVYRSKGKPKLSFVAQILHLSFLVPTCLISLNYGFWALVYARSLIRFQGVIVGFIIMHFVMGFPVLKTLKNIIMPIICALIMFCVALLLKQISSSMLWSFASMAICVLVYAVTMFAFAANDIKSLRGIIKRDI